MKRVVLALMLGIFLISSIFWVDVLGHGGQPLVAGAIPMTDPVLFVGPPTHNAHGQPIFY